MKKLFALTMASAMVLSMGVSALAASKVKVALDTTLGAVDTSSLYYYDSDSALMYPRTDAVPYGNTAYFALQGLVTNGAGFATEPTGTRALVYEADAVKGLKFKATWAMGADLVKTVEVVKKKISDNVKTDQGLVTTDYTGIREYAYFLAVNIKDAPSTSTKFVSGTLSTTKSATESWTGNIANTDRFGSNDAKFEISFDVAYNPVNAGNSSDNTVEDKSKTFDFKAAWGEQEDQELIIINDSIGTFTVDTYGQGKLVLSANNKFDADISAKFPEANLEFIKMNNARFNKTGELKLFADEGTFLYKINADGTIGAAKATYDSYEEAFLIKTRELGNYIVSDIELNLGGTPEQDVEVVVPEAPKPVNPGTGAIA